MTSRRAAGAEEPGAARLSRLGRLEHAFHTLLASHVPDAVARDGDGLARALRAAGVESAVADHVMRLRDRLRAARYGPDRKSTRLNSSHSQISYAVFCLKKKKNKHQTATPPPTPCAIVS